MLRNLLIASTESLIWAPAALAQHAKAEQVQGAQVRFSLKDGTEVKDVRASNGSIRAIDKAIMPPPD